MKPLEMRESLRFALNHFENAEDLVCAEVGVNYGENAFSIIYHLAEKLKKIYLIDPYQDEYQDEERTGICKRGLGGGEKAFEYARALLQKAGINSGKVEWLKKTSEEAANELKDVSFDYVYIDGSHAAHMVKLDLEKWYPLVKSGGIFAGHDYGLIPEVRSIVNEFFKNIDCKLLAHEDWYLIKL